MNYHNATLVLLIITGVLMGHNAYALAQLATQATPSENTGNITSMVSDVIPTGVPAIYGSELGVRFDDVSASDPRKADQTIQQMANLDRQLRLQEGDKERYINVLYRLNNGISCEYCCGARSIIFKNGKAACGCAHSFAMRGLAKYLILEHGDQYTDEELLAEIGKWKARFFPNQISAKAKILEEKGLDVNMITLTSNAYRGIEQGAGGGMVGGC